MLWCLEFQLELDAFIDVFLFVHYHHLGCKSQPRHGRCSVLEGIKFHGRGEELGSFLGVQLG